MATILSLLVGGLSLGQSTGTYAVGPLNDWLERPDGKWIFWSTVIDPEHTGSEPDVGVELARCYPSADALYDLADSSEESPVAVYLAFHLVRTDRDGMAQIIRPLPEGRKASTVCFVFFLPLGEEDPAGLSRILMGQLPESAALMLRVPMIPLTYDYDVGYYHASFGLTPEVTPPGRYLFMILPYMPSYSAVGTAFYEVRVIDSSAAEG